MHVCIVGGGGAAAVAARTLVQYDPSIRVDVFTKRQVAGYRPCELTYVLAGEIPAFEQIIGFNHREMEAKNIFYHFQTEVTDLNPGGKYITTTSGDLYQYDKLIIATGARPIIPPLPGLTGNREFTLGTDIAAAKELEKTIARYSSAAVVGGGAIGLEVAYLLKKRGYEPVYVIEAMNRILPRALDPEMAHKVQTYLEHEGIRFILGTTIKGVDERYGKKVVQLSDQDLSVDFILFSTGFRPNVDLAVKGGLVLGSSGAIRVNQYLQTSDPNIYAIGDCVENWDIISRRPCTLMLADNSVRTGKIAARNIVTGNQVIFPGSVSCFVIRLGRLYAGAIGYPEARAAEIPDARPLAVYHEGLTRPKYLKGEPTVIKLIANASDHKLLGAQLISEAPMNTDLDRFALAITNGLTIEDLSVAEISYTPATGWPHSPVMQAIDKLVYALSRDHVAEQ